MTRFFRTSRNNQVVFAIQKLRFGGLSESNEFIQRVAYIADVMYHLNELNLSLQGQQTNVITACEKLKAFKVIPVVKPNRKI